MLVESVESVSLKRSAWQRLPQEQDVHIKVSTILALTGFAAKFMCFSCTVKTAPIIYLCFLATALKNCSFTTKRKYIHDTYMIPGFKQVKQEAIKLLRFNVTIAYTNKNKQEIKCNAATSHFNLISWKNIYFWKLTQSLKLIGWARLGSLAKIHSNNMASSHAKVHFTYKVLIPICPDGCYCLNLTELRKTIFTTSQHSESLYHSYMWPCIEKK